MEKSLKYFLSALCVLFCFSSCQQYKYYKLDENDIERDKLADAFIQGAFYYYQGTVPHRFLLEEALKRNEEHALANREMGVAYLKRGFPVEFSTFYARSAELDPENWQGWRGYLYLYFYRDYEKALADFDATDILTPDFVDYPQSLSVDYMRAICYYYLHKPKKTIAYLEKHIELETETVGHSYIDSKSFLLKGLAYEDLDELNLAISSYKTALEIDTNTASIFYHLARSHHKIGDTIQATAYLEQAQVSYNKGIIYRRNYVDEFFRIYQEDIDNLANKLNSER